jgi:hypothetical protein
MEAHHRQYLALENEIWAMVHSRRFPEAFSACQASFPNIVPAIKYRKQRGIEPEMLSFLALHIICKYAPALFESFAIDSLLAFVRSTRLLAQHENGYLPRAEAAKARVEVARTLWGQLENQPGMLQRDIRVQPGVDQVNAVEIVTVWEELGVIVRRPEDRSHRLYFRTQLDAEMQGLCHNCGVRGKGLKAVFFRPVTCQKCGAEGYYHIEYADPQQ